VSLGGPAGELLTNKRDTLAEVHTFCSTPSHTHMLARISFRQVPLGARVYARSYTSSIKEGSVAASKGFKYAFMTFFWIDDD
jgi:hypothetical protein